MPIPLAALPAGIGEVRRKEKGFGSVARGAALLPEMEEEERKAKRKGWNKAVKYAYGWAKDEPEEEEE